jgi:hypothetical protein
MHPVPYVLLGRQRRHNGSVAAVLGQCWQVVRFSRMLR